MRIVNEKLEPYREALRQVWRSDMSIDQILEQEREFKEDFALCLDEDERIALCDGYTVMWSVMHSEN